MRLSGMDVLSCEDAGAERPVLSALLRAAKAWEMIRHVPSVACLDWCDRAAAAVAGAMAPCTVTLILADLAESGHILRIVQGGAAEPDRGARRQPGDLRWRLELLEGKVWAPAAAAPTATAVVAHPVVAERSLSEEAWAMMGVGTLLVGACPFVSGTVGRTLVVQCGLPGGEPSEYDASVLCAIVPGLTNAANVAIGLADRVHSEWISPREQEVLNLLILGKSVPEIAAMLCRSPHTIHDHVKNLHRKLGAKSRGELVAVALGHGRDAGFPRAPVTL